MQLLFLICIQQVGQCVLTDWPVGIDGLDLQGSSLQYLILSYMLNAELLITVAFYIIHQCLF